MILPITQLAKPIASTRQHGCVASVVIDHINASNYSSAVGRLQASVSSVFLTIN